MRICSSSRTVVKGRLAGLLFRSLFGLVLASGCRPDTASQKVSSALEGRLLSTKSRPATGAAHPSANMLLGPSQPLDYRQDLEVYLDDLVDNFSIKRWERFIAAYEPAEGVHDLYPNPTSTRARRAKDAIELHFRVGEELFESELSVLPGFGDGLDGNRRPNMHRVHRGAHGGPDATSCKSCHHRSGDDGAGEYTEAALIGGDGINPDNAFERNPPALHGGGALQILARQITEELHKQVNRPPSRDAIDIQLVADGTDFGMVRLRPDGSLDTSKVKGLDADLIVRPFGWKGTHSTLRRFAEEAFQVHHGLQSAALMLQGQIFGPLLRETSPATKAVAASLGNGPPDDPDRDTTGTELAGSQLTAMAIYLTLLPLPVIEPPRSRDLLEHFREGQATFSEIGCPSCHRPMWILKEPVWVERGEDASSPVNMLLDLRKDIRNGPPLRNTEVETAGYPIFPFTDMRRHDMGPELADKEPKARDAAGVTVGPQIPASHFFTRPLWGLADSPPYLHDGRAITIHDAILQHGGEAGPVRDNYKNLPAARQRALQVFLFSLARPTLPEVTP